METTIVILVEADNKNIVYPAAIAQVKSEIRKYFGTRITEKDDPTLPMIVVKCVVVQDDMNELKAIISNDAISLIAVTGLKNSNRVSGDIIDLSDK